MSAKAIVCPQCGAQDVSMLTQETGVCNYCGTKVTIEKEQASAPQVIVVHPAGEKQKDMGFYTCQSVWSAEQFAREAYIRLFSDPQTPVDIHKADFLPVVTEYPQFTVFSADYVLNYTVDIGHYRKEQYVDYQTKTVDGKTVKEPVVKTRTVTDWSPLSGEYKRNDVTTFGAVSLPNKSGIHTDFEDDEVYALRKHFSVCGSSGLERYEKSGFSVQVVPPSAADTKRAMNRKAKDLAYDCQQSLPGDTHSNFSYSVSAKAKDVDWMVMPEYALGFSYESERYEVRSFACEANARLSKTPQQNAQREIEDEMRSQKRKTLWLPIAGLFALFLLLSLIGVDDFEIILGLIGVVYAILHYKYWNSKVKQATAELIKQRQEEKLKHLQDVLRSMGEEALSAEEIASFSA